MGDDGTTDITVSGHNIQFPPDIMGQTGLDQVILNHSQFAVFRLWLKTKMCKSKLSMRSNSSPKLSHRRQTDTPKEDNLVTNNTAGWVDSPARPQTSCQRLRCSCSISHCWNGMAQNGWQDPQRHTCNCPALWPSNSSFSN